MRTRWIAAVCMTLSIAGAATLAQQAPPTAPPANAATALRPLEDFARLPFIENPQISPDGTKLAAKLSFEGRQVFAVYPFTQPNAKPVMMAVDNMDLNSWTWVNDEWLALDVGQTIKFEGNDLYVGRAIGFSALGKPTTVFARDAAGQFVRVIWTASDGSPRALLSVQRSIYLNDEGFWPEVLEVDVSTGRTRTVVKPREDVMSWYADASGVVRLGFGYDDDNRSARMLYRPDSDSAFKTIDRANTAKNERLMVPALFAADPTKSLTFSDHEGFDWLYELDLTTLTIGKKIFGVPGYDLESVRTDATGQVLTGVAYTDTRWRVDWLDPAMAEVQKTLDTAVGPERRAVIWSKSRDQQRMIVHVGGANQPGAYFFYDARGSALQRIAYANEAIKMARLAPVKTITYKARDGLEISAVLTLPQDREAKSLPLIMLPHGGPAARDDESYDWWAQFLANRGYAVLQPNYRGSTGFGSAFQGKEEGAWGTTMQDDLIDGITALAAQGLIDPKRVCISGASYGGYAALRAAQRDGAHYRCAISFAGVSDLLGMLRYDRKFLNAKASSAGWRESAPDLKAVSPINGVAAFSIPTLILHGKKDLRVPVQQSRDIAAKLKAAGKAVRYIEQPEGDHHFSRQADRVQFLQEMEAFLQLHNPA
jgi:dipeptidyl aminopeptidase/acylaminoacyl peptidase